jgi:ABC-type multidrug transport system ATPase subunit
MTRNAIEIRGLTKRYRTGVVANSAIDLDVLAGSVLGLLGPNGAGKTTLVRQLTGELLPTAGSIVVGGIDVARDPLRAKALMGVVPQEAGTFDVLKVEEHLLIFGRLHGLSRRAAHERADQMLLDLDLQAHRAKRSMELSGGLKRKLLVGMALMSRPPILVLDEPTTGLDPNARREVWSVVRSLRSEGATVLLTTHYMEEAEALCSRVAILGAGRILADGTVEEIRSLCRNRFKATYEEDGHTRTLYGGTHQAVVAEVERLGLTEYAVMKTSLEDLYIELTAKAPEADGVEASR